MIDPTVGTLEAGKWPSDDGSRIKVGGRTSTGGCAAGIIFFIAMLLISAVVKLLALQYSIHFYAFARAGIGAFLRGKVVLLM
jgi:hypothetical protein